MPEEGARSEAPRSCDGAEGFSSDQRKIDVRPLGVDANRATAWQ